MATKRSQMSIGLEILGDLKYCNESKLKVMNSDNTVHQITDLINKYSLIELGSFYHQFDIGFTAVIALAESHITLHTWPEFQYVSLNVYVCNHSQNNESQARSLFEDLAKLFSPKSIKKQEIRRAL